MGNRKIIIILFFLSTITVAKAQKDTTYFIFNGDVKATKKVNIDSLNYSLKVDSIWFNMKIFTCGSDIHNLVHWKEPSKVRVITPSELLTLQRKYNLTYLSSLSAEKFIAKFDYSQYNHVYYLIPLKELDEKGYKAYEFTFNSDFLDVE